MNAALTAAPLDGIPEIEAGDDLAALIAAAHGGPFPAGSVLCVSHKVVSKAERAVADLASIAPTPRAEVLCRTLGREDPRIVEVVLRQSSEVVRAERGVLICRSHHGFVCANAGVDASNAGADGRVIMLPVDPDRSARLLRSALPGRPAVVISDSFGRAWRHGQCEVAIGAAGLVPLDDWRGRSDRDGRGLHATAIAIADQVAAASDLARGGKDSGQPAVLVGGLARFVTAEDGPGVAALLRDRADDLFGA